jgi:hypothetical protein
VKQQVMNEYDKTHDKTDFYNDTEIEDDLSDPETVLLDTCQFYKMIGDKLKRYWKIGIHWLMTLRSLLAQPFDKRAIEILGST